VRPQFLLLKFENYLFCRQLIVRQHLNNQQAMLQSGNGGKITTRYQQMIRFCGTRMNRDCEKKYLENDF
jgi:hypothetical protein